MIAIIDYNAGNLTSVAHAVSYLGFKAVITSDIQSISKAERIIFPGVGAAGSAMKSLKSQSLDAAIKSEFTKGKPILGICLGTQIIMSHSDENDTSCIGIIKGNVSPFDPNMRDEKDMILKIPHMGWNSIQAKIDHPLFSGLKKEDEFYFVHSFYPAPEKNGDIIASTSYGIPFPSVIGFDNIIATQFHPEKSGKPGLTLLNNFCRWQPC